jgi:hypothetical protein
VIDRTCPGRDFVRRAQLIVRIVEFVSRLVVAIAGEDNGLVIVVILDVG